MALTAEDAATAGAEWLDETSPGWAAKIDLPNLSMRHGDACVLGQLARQINPSFDFTTVVNHDASGHERCIELLFTAATELLDVFHHEWIAEHGFDIQDDVETWGYYDRLDVAWQYQIQLRRSVNA